MDESKRLDLGPLLIIVGVVIIVLYLTFAGIGADVRTPLEVGLMSFLFIVVGLICWVFEKRNSKRQRGQDRIIDDKSLMNLAMKKVLKDGEKWDRLAEDERKIKERGWVM